jgi:hypothetical protein
MMLADASLLCCLSFLQGTLPFSIVARLLWSLWEDGISIGILSRGRRFLVLMICSYHACSFVPLFHKPTLSAAAPIFFCVSRLVLDSHDLVILLLMNSSVLRTNENLEATQETIIRS